MFNSLCSLYCDLEDHDITVFTCPLGGRKAISSADGFIGLDWRKFESEAEEVTALIHEEGHFTAGAFYTPYSPFQVRAQAEYRADKAAVLKRIPLCDLMEDLKAGYSLWEIADHFNVEPAFIWRAYTIYRDNLGVDFTASAI